MQRSHHILQSQMSLMQPDFVLLKTQLHHSMIRQELGRPRNSVPRNTQLFRYLVELVPGAVYDMHPDVPEKHRSCSTTHCLQAPHSHNSPCILLTLEQLYDFSPSNTPVNHNTSTTSPNRSRDREDR